MQKLLQQSELTVKLNYTIQEIARVVGAEPKTSSTAVISAVSIDSRALIDGEKTLFFCLKGKRNGTDFIQSAIAKGCKNFVVPANYKNSREFADVTFLFVQDTLKALQDVAAYHRKQFDYPVIGITGSAGKTIVKEWLYHFLRERYQVVRSPKSFNSQIGTALSVLEMTPRHNLAIIEAGISKSGEMEDLARMIQPNYGVFTTLGHAHDEGFENRQEKFNEKSILFRNCEWVVSRSYSFDHTLNLAWENRLITYEIGHSSARIDVRNYGSFEVNFINEASIENLCHVLAVLKELDFPVEIVQQKLSILPDVVMRMEILQGKNNNVLINDAYNMDMDGLMYALVQQREMAGAIDRVVVLGFGEWFNGSIIDIREQVRRFDPTKIILCSKTEREGCISFEEAYDVLQKTSHSVILFKGSFKAGLTPMINNLALKHHQTFLEINKSALRNNLTFFRKLISPKTKLMVMVKASSYGSGSKAMSEFLEQEGVDYLGVAFADEGIELRKANVSLPILVMNSHPAAFDDIIRHNLEPAIFSMSQLDEFTRTLILHEQTNYPIHIKLETGMNRLGFSEYELDELLAYIKSQPELRVKSVYSHLAESDNPDKTFTELQIRRFENYANKIQQVLNHKIDRHICNTSGIVNYPEAHFDMVRLGIGLFGIGNSPELQTVIQLKTHISKINTLLPGQSIGYNREHVAQKEERIAVLPIGYADGIRRVFGNHKARVLVNGQYAPIVGNVCMDMCFIDVTHINAAINDEVEFFGDNQSINQWAKWAETIPYEILTSISTRVNRVWVD
jgi:alanine racemase